MRKFKKHTEKLCYELCHEKTCILHMRKQRHRSEKRLGISTFVFAIEIVQSLYFLNLTLRKLLPDDSVISVKLYST